MNPTPLNPKSSRPISRPFPLFTRVGGVFLQRGQSMATTSQPVQYKTIERFPGYRFGDDGTVWSHNLGGEWRKRKTSKQYAPVRYGRRKLTSMRIGLYGVTPLVHRLILEAFVGPCPDGMECRHLDGDPENNRMGNLRWGTPKSNADDSVRHGTMTTKLTEGQVIEIREKYITGNFLQSELATMYGVSANAISWVLRGQSWGHIPIGDGISETFRKIAKHNQRTKPGRRDA